MNSKTDEALLDADVWARQEAIQVRGSYVVQAPAGSGKTELLTQRLLALLGAAVSEPEALLAITFTNKAAAEMRQRVLDSLIRASSQAEPDTEPDRTNWRLAKRVLLRSEQESWDLVENPGRLRIMTIDALCGSIAQQLPLLSEFGSQPNITDDAETRYREAAQEAVHYWVTRQSCEGGGHAARDAVSPLDVLLRVDNDAPRLVDLVARLLAVRDQWLTHVVNPAFMGRARDSSLPMKEHIENSVQHLRAETRAQLDRLLHSTYPGLRDALRMHFDAARFGFDVVGDASSPLARLLFTQNSTDDAADDAADDSAVFMDSLVALLSTGSPGKKQFRKVRGVTKALGFPAVSAGRSADEKARLKSGKVEFQSLLESLQSADDLLAVLNAISLLPPPRLTTVDAQTLMQLIELLLIAVACLKVGFQSAGEVDFCEVSLGAMRALHDTDNHDAVIQLSQRYQHILVDEFQDTSLTQYHLLLQLISDWQVAHTPEDEQPPTLFLVGDPMQSIYRFRQAEVGLFLQVKTHGMGPAPLQYLRLTRNFRSDPEIVEWVNTHFRSIFPPDDDVTTGRVAYRASLAGRSGTVDHADHADIVTQSPVLRGVSRGVHCDWCESDAAVVQRCVELVQRIRQAEPEASIAILVRGRRHLRAVLPALSQGNVPYEAVEARVLSTEPVVQDLLVLTNVIAEPNNGLAWAALLRSPVCGLCLEDLLVVFETQNNVWPVLVACLERSDALPDLSAEGRQLIRRVVDPLRPMIDDYPYVSLSVKARWAAWATGLLAGVADRDVDCVEAYWALLERHTREGTPYCSETFALALDKAYGSILSSCANPVQIMTIHKSKGLEFDHV
ncbi:MAG: UvrD-helicase domain-containing protein [Gammaproteobacteria bacterium]